MTAQANPEPLDTLYRAETPEGIALALRPAGLVARGEAWLIDFALRIAIFLAAASVAGSQGRMGAAFLLVLAFLLEWFYPVAFELGRSGATPGKRILGLQVVMDSGLPVTPGASMVRNLLRAADFLPFLYAAGIAALLLRTDFKRLGDVAAGTLVVYSRPVRLHGVPPAAEAVAAARPLSPGEQAAIVAWAGRGPRLTPMRFEELAQFARPVTALDDGAEPERVTQRLLGIAQWILGQEPRR